MKRKNIIEYSFSKSEKYYKMIITLMIIFEGVFFNGFLFFRNIVVLKSEIYNIIYLKYIIKTYIIFLI